MKHKIKNQSEKPQLLKYCIRALKTTKSEEVGLQKKTDSSVS